MQPDKTVNGDQLSVNGNYAVHPFDMKEQGRREVIAEALKGNLTHQGLFSRELVEGMVRDAKVSAFRAFKKDLKAFIGVFRFPTETDKFFEKMVADGVLDGEDFADDAEMQEVTNEEIVRLREGVETIYNFIKANEAKFYGSDLMMASGLRLLIIYLECLMGGGALIPALPTSPQPPPGGGEAAGASNLTAGGES